MRARLGPLLAKLHAHTTWSDGAFSVGQLVDIYGTRGFDVLCVTDHTVRAEDPCLRSPHPAYLTRIEAEPRKLAA